MFAFILHRALQGVLIVFTVVTVTFVLIHAAPGEPFGQLAEDPRYTPEMRQQLRERYWLDRPVWQQYVRYMTTIARGDLGESFSRQRPVKHIIGEAIPPTLLLMGTALAAGFALGIGLGALQGARAGSRTDRAIGTASVAVVALPDFWLAVGLLLLFGLHLGWFPVSGMVDDTLHAYLGAMGRLGDVLYHLVLPATTLAVIIAGVVARQQRSAMLETLPEDFVRTARAKGVSERAVILRHALRNALLPIITLFGLALPSLVGGAVFVESVFAWPGMGRAAVDALGSRDYPVILGVVVVASVFVVIGSLLTDLLYAAADPRLRRA